MPGNYTLLRHSHWLPQHGLNLRGRLDVAVHQVPAAVVRHKVQQVPDNTSNALDKTRRSQQTIGLQGLDI